MMGWTCSFGSNK